MLDHLKIPVPDPDRAERVQRAIDAKTKPPGSLGRIETLALQLAMAQGTDAPDADRAHLLLFAGDHGLVAEGVSAWPQDVTAQMVLNFLAGGAAANVFVRANGCEMTIADVGVSAELPDDPRLFRAGIRRGTRNALHEDAMTPGEVSAALSFGSDIARDRVDAGERIVLLGEMGIGNTASAALLAHAIAGLDLAALTGPGAGLDASGVSHKLDVLARAARRRPGPMEPEQALAAFGGLEIAAMAGALIGAASAGAVVLVDGFIATAAALAALTARQDAVPHTVFAHRSHEPGPQAHA